MVPIEGGSVRIAFYEVLSNLRSYHFEEVAHIAQYWKISADGLLMLLSLLASAFAMIISLSAIGAFAVLLLTWIRPHLA